MNGKTIILCILICTCELKQTKTDSRLMRSHSSRQQQPLLMAVPAGLVGVAALRKSLAAAKARR